MKFNVQTLFVFVFFFVCFLFFNCGSIVESCIFSNFLFGDNCIGFFRLSGFLALEVEASPLQHHPPPPPITPFYLEVKSHRALWRVASPIITGAPFIF